MSLPHPSDVSEGQSVCWSFAVVTVWSLDYHLSRGYTQTKERVVGSERLFSRSVVVLDLFCIDSREC